MTANVHALEVALEALRGELDTAQSWVKLGEANLERAQGLVTDAQGSLDEARGKVAAIEHAIETFEAQLRGEPTIPVVEQPAEPQIGSDWADTTQPLDDEPDQAAEL